MVDLGCWIAKPVHMDREDRFRTSERSFFLHPPPPGAEPNIMAFENLAIEDGSVFECELSLPAGSVGVTFTFTLLGAAGEVLQVWTRELLGGGRRRCRQSLPAAESASLHIATQVAPKELTNQKAWAWIHHPHILTVADQWVSADQVAAIARNEDDRFAMPDPWQYETTEHDKIRKGRLLSILPTRTYERTLEIGCGDGFLTFCLPGREVVGVDVSEAAIRHAKEKALRTGKPHDFHVGSLQDIEALGLGKFDLIVIAGVLYPHYVGRDSGAVNRVIRNHLNSNGVLVSCHIAEWMQHQFALCRVASDRYGYRSFTHCLEVYTDYDTDLS